MRILIITGVNLRFNESANLSHIAYIRGFCELGHEVTVISKTDKNDINDDSIILPAQAKYYMYNTSRIYSLMSKERRSEIHHDSGNEKPSLKTKLYTRLRDGVKKCYGVFGFNQIWVNNVLKHFREKQQYDLVVSISTPVESHEAAYQLLRHHRIEKRLFCEIWEDPWQLDVYTDSPNQRLLRVENRIIGYADKVIYVSPLTLLYQKKTFPENGEKMDWVPLASYYHSDKTRVEGFHYGYYGAYHPNGRNLKPFYEAAKEMQISLTICGDPYGLFEETDKIHIYPRLTLDELKKHEDKTNVLIFLCNLYGGQIPGKIYQYAATDKKILFILDGTEDEKKMLLDCFSPYERFYFCENNITDIMRAIKFLEEDNNIAKKTPLDTFSASNICSMILSKITGIQGRTNER